MISLEHEFALRSLIGGQALAPFALWQLSQGQKQGVCLHTMSNMLNMCQVSSLYVSSPIMLHTQWLAHQAGYLLGKYAWSMTQIMQALQQTSA